MRAFTERNPKAIGAVALAVMAVVVLGVIFLNRSVLQSGYPVSARFSNAAGIGKGTEVLLAGVHVGSVSSVTIHGNAVDAAMTIDDGVVLPRHTTAAVQVETLLGVVDVRLDPVSGWSAPLRPGAVITDTSVPTELYQLRNTAGKLLDKTDARALNRVVSSLAAITKGKQRQVAEIIDGLGKLTATVDGRRAQVSQLIDSANTVSSALATKDQQLASVIDNLDTVAAGLSTHSGDLASLIDNVDAMATQTNSLVGQDRPQLAALLDNLHATLGVVGQHQDDLAQAVSYLGAALKGFASVGYSGPTDTPNSWANIYVNTATVTNAYGVLGPCGVLDDVLDATLGPTPLACTAQTGPLPGTTPSNVAPGSGTTTTVPANRTGSSGSAGAAGATAGRSAGTGPNSGLGGLAQLLGPLAGGGT
ncbi:MAG TPA: MCE family protein [Acidimicrobiales bacterium]|nr:MCE family protein [Acidimicrobiales bacterium]